MGTRGAYGFYKNGITKVTYNHQDSYPDCLGRNILVQIKRIDIKKLNEVFEGIVLVDNSTKPTTKQIKEYGKFANTTVSKGKKTEWYVLLRNTQGTLKPYLNGELKHMIDSQNFLKDSLFCEWAYIINLDNNTFEIWKGSNTKQTMSRYEIKYTNNEYYAVVLNKIYSLTKLPKVKDFLNDFAV